MPRRARKGEGKEALLLDRLCRTAAWMRGGGELDGVVLTSRLRLARNLSQWVFPPRADHLTLALARSELFEAIRKSRVLPEFEEVELEQISARARATLVDRYLTSLEHIEKPAERGLVCDPSGSLGLLINEEDHLRIQAMLAGLQLEEALRWVNQIDDALEPLCSFAFSDRYGYLTACPTNVGTGLRASVMVHLPALALSEKLRKFFAAVEKADLTVRGIYGEGSEAHGNLYQISNQTTMGVSEGEIIEKVTTAARSVAKQEMAARHELLRKRRTFIEDKVWRAYGALTHARSISAKEATDLLSHLRLGVDVGLVDGITPQRLNELLIAIRPACLQTLHRRDLDAGERDLVRAEMIRTTFSGS